MNKIAILEETNPEALETKVNNFIMSVNVISIQYQVCHMWMGDPGDTGTSFSVMILYKD